MKTLIISVHGIRTFGQWQSRLAKLLNDRDSSVVSASYSYGYFSVLAFLLPLLRWMIVLRFRKQLVQTIKREQPDRLCIVAHSFGTHVVSYALKKLLDDNQVRVDLLILCASVLPTTFDWEPLISRKRVLKVINDCGINDNILILSQALVVFTGMAGRLGFYGFQGTALINRFFSGGHSHYFTDAKGAPSDHFMMEYWIPLILQNKCVSVDKRTAPTWVDDIIQTLIPFADIAKSSVYILAVVFFISTWHKNIELGLQQQRNLAIQQLSSHDTRGLGVAGFSDYMLRTSSKASESEIRLLQFLGQRMKSLSQRWDLIPVGSVIRSGESMFHRRKHGWLELTNLPTENSYVTHSPTDGVAFLRDSTEVTILENTGLSFAVPFVASGSEDINVEHPLGLQRTTQRSSKWPDLSKKSRHILCKHFTSGCKKGLLVGDKTSLRPFFHQYTNVVALHTGSKTYQVFIYEDSHYSSGFNQFWIGIYDIQAKRHLAIADKYIVEKMRFSNDCKKIFISSDVKVDEFSSFLIFDFSNPKLEINEKEMDLDVTETELSTNYLHLRRAQHCVYRNNSFSKDYDNELTNTSDEEYHKLDAYAGEAILNSRSVDFFPKENLLREVNSRQFTEIMAPYTGTKKKNLNEIKTASNNQRWVSSSDFKKHGLGKVINSEYDSSLSPATGWTDFVYYNESETFPEQQFFAVDNESGTLWGYHQRLGKPSIWLICVKYFEKRCLFYLEGAGLKLFVPRNASIGVFASKYERNNSSIEVIDLREEFPKHNRKGFHRGGTIALVDSVNPYAFYALNSFGELWTYSYKHSVAPVEKVLTELNLPETLDHHLLDARVTDEKIFVPTLNEVYAVDLKTGKIIWKSPLKSFFSSVKEISGSYSLRILPATKTIVVFHENFYCILDQDSGFVLDCENIPPGSGNIDQILEINGQIGVISSPESYFSISTPARLFLRESPSAYKDVLNQLQNDFSVTGYMKRDGVFLLSNGKPTTSR